MSGLLLARRTGVALAAILLLLGIGYLLIPQPLAQYGVWLVIFAIWMAWFVLTAKEWIAQADF